MIRLNLTYIYDLAQAIHPLNYLRYGEDTPRGFYDVFQVHNLLSCNNVYDFKVSQEVVNNFKELLENYLTKYAKDKGSDLYEEKLLISNAIPAVELLLKNELSILPAYLVTPKGAYDLSILTLNPEGLFHVALLSNFPKVKDDVEQCAKALAFDLPTACSFHLMRIFERVVREYYKIEKGAEPTSNLKDIIKKLTDDGDESSAQSQNTCSCKYDKSCKLHKLYTKNTLFGILNSIKDNYRNPIMHPDINMTTQDTLILFGVVNAAISLIIEKIPVQTIV